MTRRYLDTSRVSLEGINDGHVVCKMKEISMSEGGVYRSGDCQGVDCEEL